MGAAELPEFLREVGESDYYYGTLRYEEGFWVVEGEPAVCQVAKRLFPGAEGRTRGVARFKSNKRTNGDLNWLMMRYPLQIIDRHQWESAFGETVEYIRRREEIRRGPQKAEPSQLIFKGQLTEFQKEGVAFLNNNAPALLADDMGLGKTVEALAWIAAQAKFPGIIVVPTSVQTQWRSQIMNFIHPQPLPGEFALFPDQNKMVHTIKGLTPYELPEAQFYIIHYGLLRGWKQALPEYKFEFVVFDEIQELRHPGTEKYSSASLLAESSGNAIGLSGTPIYNKGGEIYYIMNILQHQCLGDWGSFTREWCYGYNEDVVADPEMLGDHLRREGLMLRRTKEQVLTELPPKRRIVQDIDSDDKVFIKEMRSVMELVYRYDKIEGFEKGRAKQEIGERMRQATGISKAPYVAAFVKMLLEAGEAVVLYGYHHEVYEIWMEELSSFNPVRVSGIESQKQKEEAKQKFINGETNLIIISLRAAAGIDGLQHRANINVFGELDWSPGIHSQCEDRTHRMGQQDSVISYYLVCGNGSDEQMMEALGFKTAQFAGIMGEKTESEEDKAIAQVEVGKHLDKVIEKLKSRSVQK
ncbi:helicase SNF2 [Cohnella kolymensis]|uniref:Helicase SNF2 n=1 Tax=Cohnella kolymensis TaxID=1590652 RepID=A0ABR5A3Y7_9BACL|nr:DEAD/DEAH box helicase [Cohnella kolymensis]KIL35142.1 helicase SNF2 [Cohnella kolymensis]